MTAYPNARNNPAGAIPVYLSVASNAMPIVMEVQPIGFESGPIPVYFVTAPINPPYPNDQGNPASAIPVIESVAPNAMPVWETGIAPPSAPVNTILPVISPTGPVAHGATLTVNNGTWSGSPTIFYYGWARNGIGIAGANTNTYVTTIVDQGAIISAIVQGQNATAPGIAVSSSNTISVT